jgi:hypothetical protein
MIGGLVGIPREGAARVTFASQGIHEGHQLRVVDNGGQFLLA